MSHRFNGCAVLLCSGAMLLRFAFNVRRLNADLLVRYCTIVQTPIPEVELCEEIVVDLSWKTPFNPQVLGR